MKIRVLVIEHSLPFYHVPCWALLGSHPGIELTVAQGTGYFTGPNAVPEGRYDESMPFRLVRGRIVRRFFGKTVLWHESAVRLVKEEAFDVVIHQFETKIISLWRTRHVVERRGGKFIFWGIGQSLKPTPALDVVRWFLARRADALVFYADSNRARFVRMGLDARRLFVAPNSIDLQPITSAAAKWPAEAIEAFKRAQGLGPSPVLIHVGRLMTRKRLDLLIAATALLKHEYPEIVVILVGNGPEERNLREMVRAESLEDHFRFLGTISGEESLAPWFLSSDVVVAPGQVGHLATHAHAYGRPLVACDDPSIQGPEIGILVPGRTGEQYRYGDIDDLARVIGGLLDEPLRRWQMGDEGRRRASKYCGTPRMANGFLEAISYVTATELRRFGEH